MDLRALYTLLFCFYVLRSWSSIGLGGFVWSSFGLGAGSVISEPRMALRP